MSSNKTISIVVPVYNEQAAIVKFHTELSKVIEKLPFKFEIIFVNDGSRDASTTVIKKLRTKDRRIKLVELVRNFGKEIALTAGLNACTGDAAIMIDVDLQHPPRYIPKLVRKWRKGAPVVVGIRAESGHSNVIRIAGSKLFYWLLNQIAHIEVVPRATDFRLVDREVIDHFNGFTERNRITRGLIDWLGYPQEFIEFDADERVSGTARYSKRKLLKLAMDSFISMSLVPLKLSGYLGVIIILVAGPMGLFMFLDQTLLGDQFRFSGPASLGVLIIFLVGIILANLGLVALYIANIHEEVANRPLYITKRKPQ